MAGGVELATAYVSLVVEGSKVGPGVRRALGGTEREADRAGNNAGKRFASKFGLATKVGGGLAIAFAGKLAKDSIALEAAYSKTMNVVQATTGASAKSMGRLSDLAMKMGADTVFSANESAEAMLELARGGIRPLDIEAGALEGTLTLAAAGELEMAEAANTAVKAMGAFGLRGKDMDRIAAALAGSANASSASVRDMGIALAQGGLAADAVGFSIEETTGILAAFSNAGLEGSDAGTSLKTMLDRLQPSTEKVSETMKDLGIITEEGVNQFVKANGEFESAAKIAEVLHTATEDLTDSERKRALSVIFGSDAQRAATILAKEGAKGLRPLIKATSDTGAAQEMAAANMKGTAGALERMSGSIETAKLKFGQGLAPAVQQTADRLAEFVDRAPLEKWGEAVGDAIIKVIDVIEDMTPKVKGFMDAVNDVPGWAIKLAAGGGAGLFAASKVNNLFGGKGRGLLGGGGVQKVFVVNPGFGAGGVDGPGKKGGVAATAGKAAGAAGLAAAASAIATDLIFKLQKNVAPKAYDKGIVGTPNFGSGIRLDFDDDKAKVYNATIAKIAQTMGSLNGAVKVAQIAASGLDREMSALAQSDPGKAFQLFNKVSRETGVNVQDLAAALPKTSKAMRQAGVTTGEWSNRVRMLGGEVKKVEGKKPSVAWKFPGLDDGRTKTTRLGGEVDRVGKKKPSPHFSFPGLLQGIGDALRLDNALDAAAQDRTANIRIEETYVRVNAGAGGRFTPRAAGGAISPGKQYVVGERGPEFFTSMHAGRITPNHQMQASGGSGGGGVTINGNLIGVDAYDLARQLQRRERDAQNLARLP